MLTEIASELLISQAKSRLRFSEVEILQRLKSYVAAPIDDTSIITLTIESLDPLFSADFANAWAEVVIQKYTFNEATRPVVIDRAIPSYSPSTPRNIGLIHKAFIAGTLAGLAVAGIITLIAYKHPPSDTFTEKHAP